MLSGTEVVDGRAQAHSGLAHRVGACVHCRHFCTLLYLVYLVYLVCANVLLSLCHLSLCASADTQHSCQDVMDTGINTVHSSRAAARTRQVRHMFRLCQNMCCHACTYILYVLFTYQVSPSTTATAPILLLLYEQLYRSDLE